MKIAQPKQGHKRTKLSVNLTHVIQTRENTLETMEFAFNVHPIRLLMLIVPHALTQLVVITKLSIKKVSVKHAQNIKEELTLVIVSDSLPQDTNAKNAIAMNTTNSVKKMVSVKLALLSQSQLIAVKNAEDQTVLKL